MERDVQLSIKVVLVNVTKACRWHLYQQHQSHEPLNAVPLGLGLKHEPLMVNHRRPLLICCNISMLAMLH